jgi:hypothetical protein
MQWLQRRQMVQDMATIWILCDLCQEFSTQPLLVREVAIEVAIQVLSKVYQL